MPDEVIHHTRHSSADFQAERAFALESRMSKMEMSIETLDKKVDDVITELRSITNMLVDMKMSEVQRSVHFEQLQNEVKELQSKFREKRKESESEPKENSEISQLVGLYNRVKVYALTGFSLLLFLIVINILGKDFNLNLLKLFSTTGGGH